MQDFSVDRRRNPGIEGRHQPIFGPFLVKNKVQRGEFAWQIMAQNAF